MAKDSGEHDICNYIRENFPLENSLRLYNRSKKRSLSVHRKMKGLFFREIVSSLVRGNFEIKRKYLLSLAHSRFGKFGNNISVGRHFECERISNVFIYDNVIIGNNMVVKGNCGRLVIRSGVRIGNNFRVCTFDGVDKMNVILGKKCVIGDNVCVHPGICIADGMVIPSNSIL